MQGVGECSEFEVMSESNEVLPSSPTLQQTTHELPSETNLMDVQESQEYSGPHAALQLQEESHGPCITQADPDECTQPTYDDAVVNDDTSVNDSIDNDIVGAILKAFGLAEQMGASQKQFMDICILTSQY